MTSIYQRALGSDFCFERFSRGFFILLEIAGRGLRPNFESLGMAFFMPRQRHVDQSRHQGVDGDPVFTQFERRRLHESDDAPFRCRIGCAKRRAVAPLRRRRHNDAALEASHHRGSEGANRIRCARQVHVDGDVPV